MATGVIVSSTPRFTAKVIVTRHTVDVVNPNGRNYEADNITRNSSEELLHVTVVATDMESLRKKIATITETVEGSE